MGSFVILNVMQRILMLQQQSGLREKIWKRKKTALPWLSLQLLFPNPVFFLRQKRTTIFYGGMVFGFSMSSHLYLLISTGTRAF